MTISRSTAIKYINQRIKQLKLEGYSVSTLEDCLKGYKKKMFFYFVKDVTEKAHASLFEVGNAFFHEITLFLGKEKDGEVRNTTVNNVIAGAGFATGWGALIGLGLGMVAGYIILGLVMHYWFRIPGNLAEYAFHFYGLSSAVWNAILFYLSGVMLMGFLGAIVGAIIGGIIGAFERFN